MSGAKKPNLPQKDFSKNLGGYISSTPVPNNRLNSIFGEVTNNSLNEALDENVAVFLLNNTEEKITEVTLQQIEDGNLFNYNFGVVELSKNENIELIDDMNDYPFDCEFTPALARREEAIIKIENFNQVNLEFSIMGIEIQSQPNIDDIMSAIIQAFQNSEFVITRESEFEFKMKRIAITKTDSLVEIISNDVTFSSGNFQNGIDNGILLIESLEPNEAIGLWIQRSLKSYKFQTNLELEKEFDEINGINFVNSTNNSKKKVESVELLFNWK